MARNERVCPGWPQQQRSTSSKSHSNRAGGPRSGGRDDLGDIMNLISGCNKNKVCKESWPIHPNDRNYPAPDCCLKNGRIHCSCLWSKNEFSGENPKSRQNYRKTALANDLCDRKMPFLLEANSSIHPGRIKMAEEYVLDDNELCFDFYDMPFNMPKRHQVRKVGKVKTVSIIDTLSELASGATDREDEGGFSSAVSESAILGYNPYRSRVKHARHSSSRRGHVLRGNYFTLPNSSEISNKVLYRSPLNENSNVCTDSVHSTQIPSIQHGDEGNITCSSLKRTLKYLKKAVSNNVVEEEPYPRRHIRRHEENDAFRQCFSDSEVREIPKPWIPMRHAKPELSSRTKSRSLLTVAAQSSNAKHQLKSVASHSRQRADAPEWIKKVFAAAKKGDVAKLKEGLQNTDSALVRNLSDDYGNNLWHICSAYNNVQCLDWLCSHNKQQANALTDENKHGFTPVALAVKHGSLLSVQWLIHNTVSKSQLTVSGNTRSLLHIAAKYGQETTVQWLLSYMNSQEININGTDSEGNTPLHLAAKHGHINCAKALVFQNGTLKARNERGLKPINLAIKYSQVNCADYLLAMESCQNLATSQLKQQSELQHFQKEAAELKFYFKEVLTLTKRLQQRQKELVQSFTRISHSGQFQEDKSNRSDKCAKYADDYIQLLAAVIADEENRLLLVEEKWKKSRTQPRVIGCKKTPLDIIRSQFTHILNKVNDQSPAIPSTPETSDDSWQSEEDDASHNLPSDCSTINNISSTPDVIHALPTQNIAYADTNNKETPSDNSCNKETIVVPNSSNSDSPAPKKLFRDIKSIQGRCISSNTRDVNLQVFFKQNPNLRQTSETCSVLEVLEPSSSDSDECLNKKKCLKKVLNNEDETVQSSSSSAAETLSPSSCGPSSTESKKSGSGSSSNGSKHKINTFQNSSVVSMQISSGLSKNSSDISDNKSFGSVNNKSNDPSANDALQRNSIQFTKLDNSCLAEPDLIRGTQKKKRLLSNMLLDRDLQQKDLNLKDVVLTDNPSISTDSESLEADRSFCSAIDIPDSLISGQLIPDTTVIGTGVKKKSFLLKFALRGRWPSKHTKPRSSKNEISAEEFRETYSRSSENSPSQCNLPFGSTSKKILSFPIKDSEKLTEAATVFDIQCSVPRGLENNSSFSSCGDISRATSLQHSTVGMFPTRRDPPPIPPRPPRDDETSQIISGEIMDDPINSPSCVTSCMTESTVSLNEQYMTNSSSSLWQSPDSKSLFRPASSASRVESLSRVEDSFPLNKSSSASTEMLSALDSSTAGRQSPAPSEVSKTESALSPPSDVSKTESARHLSQLGRIEESSHMIAIKASSTQKTTEEQTIVEDCTIKDDRKDIEPNKKSKKRNPDKPWYEFSDEEDIIIPQRYEVMSGRMQSSSEDEEIITS